MADHVGKSLVARGLLMGGLVVRGITERNLIAKGYTERSLSMISLVTATVTKRWKI